MIPAELPERGYRIDHPRLLGDRHYRREVLIDLRRLARQGLESITLLHFADSPACCEADRWLASMLRLQREVVDDGDVIAIEILKSEFSLRGGRSAA